MKASLNLIKAGTALALAALPALASAGLVSIASDDFNAAAPGALAGSNGGSGWSGAWSATNPANATVAGALPADSPMGGNAVRFTGNSDNAARRGLSSTQSGNVVVEFLFQFDAGTVTNNDFLGLWFGSTTGPNIGLKANCGNGSCSADLFARTSGSDSGGTVQNIVIGRTYSIMGHLQKTGASAVYNRFDLWIDPTAAERASLTGWDAFDTGASSISSFSTIGFRSVNLATADALLVDNLSLSRVPEPGSLALVGLALAGLGGLYRRKGATA